MKTSLARPEGRVAESNARLHPATTARMHCTLSVPTLYRTPTSFDCLARRNSGPDQDLKIILLDTNSYYRENFWFCEPTIGTDPDG